MSEPRKGLFHAWVPQPLGWGVIAVLTLTSLTTNGLYTANITDMVGALATMTEYLSMANFASSIGMMVVFPFLLRFKSFLPGRQILLLTLSGTLLLSLVCAWTASPVVLIGANFITGGLKMLTMMEVIIPIMTRISPDGNRGRFYAVFYPLSIGIGQIGAYFSALLSYEYGWQYVYYFMSPGLLLSLALVTVFYHNERTLPYAPLKGLDWRSFFLVSACLMLLNYLLVFARVEDYFSSPRIQGAAIGFVITLLWFVKRQLSQENPYLDLRMLRIRNVWVSVVVVFLVGLFLGAGSIQSVLTTSVLGYSPLTNAGLNLWMIPGIVLGGLLLFYWNKYERNLKGLFLIGFGSFVLAYLLLYTKVSPGAGLQDFYLASALRGLGMVVLFATAGVYLAFKLQMMQMMAASSILVAFRSFIGPAVFSAFISYGLYHGQQENLQQLAQHLEATSPAVAARGAASGGTLALYGAVAPQALLLAAQELLGKVVMAGLWIMLAIGLFRFGSLNRRRLVNWRRKWRAIVAAPAVAE